MKKIGILGGMGPDATILFYREIIKIFQKRFNAKYDKDYPEMYICNLPIPDIIEGVENSGKTMEMLSESLKKLESVGAEFIAIPCNTINIFYGYMRNTVSIPILNIQEETAKAIAASGCKTVGILGTKMTIEKRLFDEWLNKSGIELLKPSKEEIGSLTEIITNICSGKKLKKDKERLKNIIDGLVSKGAEGIIMGCTDLPILLSQKDAKARLFDTIEILAESTVAFAKGYIQTRPNIKEQP